MRKLVFVTVLVTALALCLAGCGSSASSSASGSVTPASSDTSSAASAEASVASQDVFDGSGFEEVGDGTMYVATPGGTSENGNIPQVAGMENPQNSAMSIEVDYWDGDGSVCTVYVDGVENCKINAGDVQESITITGDTLTEGVHTVEVVKMDGDKPVIYKKAQYEIVV